MFLTWFDTNTWFIEIGQKNILVDPWLVGPLLFGQSKWLFRGTRPNDPPIPDQIDLILLSQGLEDHAHPPTLKKLNHNIPVIASPNATKVVQEIGYQNITTLKHGENLTIDNQIDIKAIPSCNVGVNTIENGYIIKELINHRTIYYEPHGFHHPMVKDSGQIEIVITPVIDLSLPLFGSIIKGTNSAFELAQMIKPNIILSTAAQGNVKYEGLLLYILKLAGGPEELQQLLIQNQNSAKVIQPKPLERIEL